MENDARACALLHRLAAHAAGATSNPFFMPNARRVRSHASVGRDVRIALPTLLIPTYAAWPPDTEFVSDAGVIFLSEDEIRARSGDGGGPVDFAFKYVGMGHVKVYSHVNGAVVEGLDGGANGHDRLRNSENRRRQLDEADGSPFSEWCVATLGGADA